jgi:hypothetical protein
MQDRVPYACVPCVEAGDFRGIPGIGENGARESRAHRCNE